jgi:ATP:ADP antiporter, AAA family
MKLSDDFFDVRRAELRPALLMFGFFFAVIAGFQVLKPLKKGLFVAHFGAEQELIAKGLNIDVAFAAMVAFSFLYNRLGGRRLVTCLVAIFLVALAIFAALISDQPSAIFNYAFYLFGDLWSTIWVATFWAFLNEISSTDQSKRLYGLIGTGGLLGGIFGSALVTSLVRGHSARPLVLLCIVLTLFIWLFTFQTDRLARRPGAALRYHERPMLLEHIRTRAAFDGARMVLKSKYLLSIVCILALYEFCSQILDFQFSSVLAAQMLGGRNTQAYLAGIYLITNILSLIVQFVLTSFLLKRFGPGAGLIVLPAAMALSSGAFFWDASLWMGSLLIISDNGLNYSINQTSRETLFVPTSSDAQYKARAFTNMFVQRLAKGAATLVAAAFILIGVRWLSLITIVITTGWITIALFAGRRFRLLSEQSDQKEIATIERKELVARSL